VSLLLITTGLASEYRTIHLNNLLKDKERMDPYERSSTLERPITRWNDPQPIIASLPARKKDRPAQFFLKELHFSKKDITILCEFIGSYTTPNLNPMRFCEQFSLKNKLQLSMQMWNDIIPNISQFVVKQVTEKDKNDVMRN
jgi:hypothetical protein